MKSKRLLILLLLALIVPWAANAQETLTVYDGTNTNSNVPFYGLYADTQGAASECVIPSDQLEDMACGQITAMKFYISSPAAAAWTGTHQVYLGEVADTTLTGITGPTAFTVVKTASFDATGTELTITFDAPYEYGGGNLLIGTYVSVAGNYKSASFYGVSQTENTGWYRNGASATGYGVKFLPKTTFTYTPSPYAPPATIAYTNNEPGNTTVSWTAPNTTETVTGYKYRYKKTAVTDWDGWYTLGASTTSVTLPGLDYSTEYKFEVKAVYGENESCAAKKVTFATVSDCMTPENLTITNVTSNSATFNWTEGFGQGSWTFGYKKTTEEAYTTMAVAAADLPLTLEVFEENTTYDVKVYPVCDETKFITDQFITKCEPIDITAAPYNNTWEEDFEDYSSGTFNVPCWENVRLVDGTGNGSLSVFQVYTFTNGSNATHQLQLPDMKSGTMTKLMLPGITLPNNNYQFVIDVFRNNSTANYTEGIRVFASADGEIEDATELAFISRSYTTVYAVEGDTIIPAESAQGWYTYALPIPMSGTCYIILRGESRYGSSTYMDNFMVEPVPTCDRPSALMLETPSARTAHTATLKWTNGTDDQTAWQIAYCTASTFNPDTVTIVDADSNPFTLTGLNQSTTYYAYVRANCGTAEEPDYSKWSSAKATFKTLEGNKKPTNLAYDPATLTSSSVRVNWKGVATNELHMYYELYYDTLSTRPNPLVAENLKIVQGEIDTTYLLEGLQAEKKYYVWVRDTCGTDGYSAWTSSINFTTASACQTPDGLAANDVTINSASITWNTYGQTGFNLRYRALGEEWTDKNSVSTPCPLTGLTPNTPYQVLVQRTCNTEVWSDTLNFRTDCTPKTITETDFINEGFEDYVGTTYNTAGVVPYCWDNYSTSATYPYPHIVGSGSYYYVHGGTKSLNFESDYGHATYVALPEFTNDLNTLQVSFWMRMENASQGYLTLGYITAEDVNYNTYTVIDSCQRSSSMVQNMLYLALKNVPSTATRLVFKWIYEGNNYYACCIDDVVVKLAPSCIPVKTFATSNVKAHSVDLAWTLYDETQTSFDVQYSVSQNFTEGDSTFINNGVSLTEGKYVLSGLTHDTTYYVRVRANCGGGEVSPWSDSKRVVTPAGNQAPSTFAIVSGSEGPHYVSLVWNQGGELAESWDLYYVKSETAPEEAPTVATPATVTVNTLPTAEAPYLLEGLDAESRYYIWVRANCGIDGLSAWKALTGACFTTLEACPTPVNGEVTNMTPVSAQLNWTGYAENYNVQYREAASWNPLYFEGFENGIPSTWTNVHREGDSIAWFALSEVLTYFPGTEQWYSNLASSWSHSGNDAVTSASYVNGHGARNVSNWLITPQLDLQGTLRFYVRSTADSFLDSYEVLLSITTADTTAFTTTLKAMGTAPYAWTVVSIDLGEYAGQTGYIAIHHVSNNNYFLVVDDFGLYEPIAAGEWSASIPAVGDSLVIERLSPETAYEWKVQAVCGGEDGSSLWSDSTMFTTPSACDAPVNLAATNETYNSATLSWSNYQETYNLRYRTAADADIYLEDSFEDGELGDWTAILTSTYGGGGAEEGFFYFGYTYNPPQYLISPLLDENGVVEGSTLYFLYQGSDDDDPETFQVGYSSTTNDVSAFTWGTTITIGEDGGVYSQTIPAGTKYFAIKHTAYNTWYLYVANFLVFGPVTPAGEWVDVEGPVENPYTLAGLDSDTPYEFQVQGNNTSCEGDTTAWSQSGWFETLPLPTQTIALSAGVNWFSTNLEITLNDLKAALVAGAYTGSGNIVIKAKTQTTTYNGSSWRGTLTWDVSRMYYIQVPADCEITLTGMPINPADHPVAIAPGANWIAFPLDEVMQPAIAFAGFAITNDVVKSKTGSTKRLSNGNWRGTNFPGLEPWKGYVYNSVASETRTLVFPTSSSKAAPKAANNMQRMVSNPSMSQTTKMGVSPFSKADKKADKNNKIKRTENKEQTTK